MPVAFIMDFPGGTAADYDAVMEDMDLGGRLPADALFHSAGASQTGWRVYDVWDSAEAFGRFAETKIGPITAKHGLPEPQIRSFEARTFRRGESGPVAVVQLGTFAGVDADRFEALSAAALGESGEMPPGNVLHVNGPAGADWCVLSAWTSTEARDAFIGERLIPALAKAGIESRPDIEAVDVHNSLTEPARERQQA